MASAWLDTSNVDNDTSTIDKVNDDPPSPGGRDKAFADRPMDRHRRVIIRHAGRLDCYYVRSQLAPLAELKDAPDLLRRLDQRRAELDR